MSRAARAKKKAEEKAEYKRKLKARAEFERAWTTARTEFLRLDQLRTSSQATQTDLDQLQQVRRKLARMAAKRPQSYDLPRSSSHRRPVPKGGVRRVVQGGSPGLGKGA